MTPAAQTGAGSGHADDEGFVVNDFVDFLKARGVALGDLTAAWNGSNGDAKPFLRVRYADEIEPRNIKWLWEPYIPMNMLTLFVGDPGVGKSYVTLSMAAAVTRGDGLAGEREKRPPADVLMMNYEDTDEEVTVPRIERFGQGPGRIGLIEGVGTADGDPWLFASRDLALLEDHLKTNPRIALVVIDPMGSYMSGKIDAFRDNEVRDVLSPLVHIAKRHSVAVMAVMHLNKDQQKAVLYRVGGSIGFVGVPRSVLLAGEEPATGRKALAHIKSANSYLAVSREYAISGDSLTWMGDAPDLTKEKLVSTAKSSPTKQMTAKEWLRSKITDKTVPVEELKIRADEAGYSWGTIRLAAKEIPIVKHQPGASGSRGRAAGTWTIHGGDDAGL
jgi:hypothetical protein